MNLVLLKIYCTVETFKNSNYNKKSEYHLLQYYLLIDVQAKFFQ